MRLRRAVPLGIAAVILVLVGTVTDAAAVLPPTTVGPERDYFRLGLPAGQKVHEKVSGTDTACTASSKPTLPLGTNDKNQIPTDGNPSTAGHVIVPINRLAMTDCVNSMPGVLVDVDNFGGWKLLLQHKASGDVASIRIPKKGSIISLVIQGSPNVFCLATVAPNGPVTVAGEWTNGSPAKFKVTDAQVPAEVQGDFPCPQGSVTGSISVTFNVINVSHPGTPIAVN
jgi:hypothetical protein